MGGAALNIKDLFLQAGPVVQAVMLLLLCMAAVSAAIIYSKWRQIKRFESENERFLNHFWQQADPEAIAEMPSGMFDTPLLRIFKLAFEEFKTFQTHASFTQTDAGWKENVQRNLSNSLAGEMALLEKRLGFLATTASAAPFIGLFGTVWGIMQSFIDIHQKGSTSLAVVAPGIAEALIATAMGLFAAIPAVVFYNYLRGRIRFLKRDMDGFALDLLNLLVRYRMKKAS